LPLQVVKLLAAGAKTNVKNEVKTIRVEDCRGAEGSFPCHLCLAGAFLARFFCFLFIPGNTSDVVHAPALEG
jgi:hypothetical protein